jgi:signal transduction histidine kinase
MTGADRSEQRRLVSPRTVLLQALHPPVGEASFWAVQVAVLSLAALHFYLDAAGTLEPSALPTGSPVALLLIPVLYSSLRHGLAGSAATALEATILWLPDLALPEARGHPADDLIELIIVDAVAIFVGVHVERGLMHQRRAEAAEMKRREADSSYRDLFDTSFLPVTIIDPSGLVTQANPAARAAFGDDLIGQRIDVALGVPQDQLWQEGEAPAASIETLDGVRRAYRLLLGHVRTPSDDGGDLRQLVFQDVTQEYRERAAVRSYAALLLAAQEDERRRIAHEIHDDPLQRLIHLARRIDHPVAKSAHEPASTDFVNTRVELLEVIGRLRDIARGLRPPGLDQLGLVAAVRGLLADVEDAANIRVELDVAGSAARLAPEVELGAFRIIQEAVRNVTRHASARALRLDLHYDQDALHIQVVDDGIGFDVPSASLPSGLHLGLVGMRERASLLGGRLAVSSVRGAGTTIDVALPAPPPSVPAEG